MINDAEISSKPIKGRTIDLVSERANAVTKDIPLKWDDEGNSFLSPISKKECGPTSLNSESSNSKFLLIGSPTINVSSS